jgi:hypothetical protein
MNNLDCLQSWWKHMIKNNSLFYQPKFTKMFVLKVQKDPLNKFSINSNLASKTCFFI